MKWVIIRCVEILNKRHQYKSKKDTARFIEFKKGIYRKEFFIKFKDNPEKTIRDAVLEGLKIEEEKIKSWDCETKLERWKIKNCPDHWTQETKLKAINVEDVIVLEYCDRLDVTS